MIPKISIITPTLNQAKFIESTITSVQEQDYSNLEHIIVDGGSTDGTLSILERYEGKIRWISEKDKGQADAVNKGLQKTTGEIIGWLNSDDLYLPGTLWKVARFFQGHPGVSWLYGGCRIIDEEGREIRKWITRYKNFLRRRFSYKKLLLENFISQPSVFFRRDVIDAIGLLDVNRFYVMDYEYWLRLAREFPPSVMREDLACFRMHGTCKSHLGFKRQFREEYEVAKIYSHWKVITSIHWFNYWKIVTIYRLLSLWNSKKDPVL